MKNFLLILYFLFSVTAFAQTGTIGAITTHTKTGTGTAEPPIPGTYDLYVDDSGSDANPGSQTEPVATINRAAQLAQPGDVVGIMGGTYRETVVPLNSGTAANRITYEGIPGQIVLISGTNDLGTTGWTVHSGNIYRKTIALPVTGWNANSSSNTTLLANQIFRNGEMMFEARWPNIADTSDLFDRGSARPIYSGGGGGTTPTSTTIVDASAPAGMTGATIWLNGWYITMTVTVTGHSGSTLTFTPGNSDAKKRKFYYLTGKLSLLDAEKEWHYEAGVLYFRQPGGGTPSGTLEYKARNYGFDLSGKSYITIHNIHFFGCNPVQSNNAISGATATSNVIVDNIRASFINHAVLEPLQPGNIMETVYQNPEQTGIKLIGPDNILRNSEIHWGSSQAVWIGERGIVTNNKISHFGYDGSFGAVMPWGPNSGSSSGSTHNQKITWNTIYTMGRSCVDFSHQWHGAHLNIELAYNNWYDYCRLNTDGGALYVGHFINTTGLVTHHNWIHDTGAAFDDGIVGGLYYDQGSGPSLNHHNILYNNIPPASPVLGVGGATDYFATPDYEDRNAGPSRIENNVFASTSSVGDTHSYKTSTFVVDQQRNNIYREDAICCQFSTTAPNITFSLKMNVDPLFIGTGAGGLAFRLGAGSPGINTGTTIAGITDGNVGTPDIGAYELGGTEWIPGYVPVIIDAIPPSGDNDLDALGSVSPITVAFNTDFGSVGLPATVSCTFDDASSGVVGLTWAVGTYSQLGSPYTDAVYTLVGTPVEVGGITNDDGLTVTCDVTVQDMFQNVTSTIAGIYDFTRLVNNTTNTYGTVNSTGDITLVKSLAPGPTGRDYNTYNTAPKLVGNHAEMVGTGAFQQSTVNTDLEFEHYNATAANLKWTEIIALSVTDVNLAFMGIGGHNGHSSANNGLAINFNSLGTNQIITTYITGNGSEAIGANATSAIIPGTPSVIGIRVDNSLAAGSKVKTNRGTTIISSTSTGSFTFDNVPIPPTRYNMGDMGTNSNFDMTGNYYYRVVLSGVLESDAVINKLITDIAAVCGITL